MQPTVTSRVILGPLLDLARYVRGEIGPPPTTRRLAEGEIGAAQAALAAHGCDLSGCTVTNLHTARVPLSADRLYDLALHWESWPCSAFFACLTSTMVGVGQFSYRFYGALPIVLMRLSVARWAAAIIYRITHGIGRGGYHAFLLSPLAEQETAFSIFTTFPPTWFFFEGLHDQMNYDIYLQLHRQSMAL